MNGCICCMGELLHPLLFVRRQSIVNISHLWLLWNHLIEFQENWRRPLPSLHFSSRSENHDSHPGLWLAKPFSTSSLQPLNAIRQNMTKTKNSISSIMFVFLEADRKAKIAAKVSDCLRHFLLLFWNRRTEFEETCQEIKYYVFYQICVIFWPIRKPRWPLWHLIGHLIGLDIFDFFSAISERNLRTLQEARSRRLLPSFCFFVQIGKPRWPLWPLICWNIFNFILAIA